MSRVGGVWRWGVSVKCGYGQRGVWIRPPLQRRAPRLTPDQICGRPPPAAHVSQLNPEKCLMIGESCCIRITLTMHTRTRAHMRSGAAGGGRPTMAGLRHQWRTFRRRGASAVDANAVNADRQSGFLFCCSCEYSSFTPSSSSLSFCLGLRDNFKRCPASLQGCLGGP